MTKQSKIFLGVAAAVVVLLFCVRFFLGVQTTTSYGPSGMMDSAQGGGYDASSEMAVTAMPVPSSAGFARDSAKMMPPVSPGGSVTQGVERLVIKTGELSMVVKDVKSAVQAISSFALKNGGFVVSSNISKPDIAPYATVIVRIPVAVFDSGITEVKALGDVESESVTGSDVTEEYVDMGARLKNLQATEQQFMVIMRSAVKVSDILEVQRQLTQVRGEIESMQGRMKYLKDSASYSTLTVNLSTDPSVLPVVDSEKNSWKPGAVIKDALRTLKVDFQYIAETVIWFVVYIPFWALSVLCLWVAWKIVRAIHAKYLASKINKM